MTKDMSNKDIITLYAMHVRWVSSGIDSLKPITLLSDKEVALIEEAIKASACSLSPLQRAALQGRIGGLTNEQIAKATGYSAAYVCQALNSSMNKIDFSSIRGEKSK